MRFRVATEDLVRMYVDQKMNAEQIGHAVGMTGTGVLYRLRLASVALRDRRHSVSTTELRRLYEVEGLGPTAIAARLGIPIPTVAGRLKRGGFVKRDAGWSLRKAPTALLVAKYAEGLSLKELAQETGMSKGAIRARLERNGHARRSPTKLGWANPKHDPKEHPTMAEIGWAAGVYEGEGSVVVRTDSKYKGGRPIVSVVQKDTWLCVRLQALFGGSVHIYANRTGAKYNYWRLAGIRGVGFLMTIYNFLSPRRQQQIREAWIKTGLLTREPVAEAAAQ